MFNYITDSSFIKFLLDYKDSIFILEDCESLLVSRDGEKNSAIQTLLSISDGILGDSLKIKFICTFNTDLNNIDKAILRKGRLKVKYEFKDLTKDKVEKIFEKQNIPTEYAKEMPLCDAYNFSEDDYNENISKIGF
jgi:SpoVK/Ycf46/Vps4 family AAA+-type ATPase